MITIESPCAQRRSSGRWRGRYWVPNRALLTFTFLLVECGRSCWGAERAGLTLTGILRDAVNNETLPYVTVEVKGTATSAVSNRDSYFALSNLPAGVVILRVTSIGYRPAEVEVKVPAQRQPLAIKLERLPSSWGLGVFSAFASDSVFFEVVRRN